jgi:hypothetical protein
LEWRATQSYIAAARGNESRARGAAKPRNREGGRGGSVERGTLIPPRMHACPQSGAGFARGEHLTTRNVGAARRTCFDERLL